MAEGRHFLALWPDRAVCERLGAEARQAFTKGRLHHLVDLHMTLVFLGEISEAQVHCVEAAAGAVRGRSFSLRIDGIGYWHRPRILWAGPTRTPEALSQLVFDLQNGLKACGFEPERRRYQPHVTLYRKAPGGEPRTIEPAIEWSVSEFVLATSGVGAHGGPRYRILRRWALSPETAPAP